MDDLSIRGGFTLIELLTVVGIIVVLMSLLLVGLSVARRRAAAIRVAADMSTLSQGLEAYRADFKDYPRIDYAGIAAAAGTANIAANSDRFGAITLCWALLAPGTQAQDGVDGAGFHLRGTTGQVWGPYIQPGRFSVTGTGDYDSTINDVYGHPYLYFPLNKAANYGGATPAQKYVDNVNNPAPGTAPAYNVADNTLALNTPAFMNWPTEMPMIMGADSAGLPKAATATSTAKAPVTLPYILWSSGEDELFGINPSNGKTDDVTNFDIPADLRR